MNWFFIALIAPALWAVTNYIDKYLLEKHFKTGGAGALLIFSALIGLPLIILIPLFDAGVFVVGVRNAIIMIISGSVYLFGFLPYFYALKNDEASFVVPYISNNPYFYLCIRVYRIR